MSKSKLTIGVLACGTLGFKAIKDLVGLRSVKFIMTDKNSNAIISFCKSKNIDCFIGDPKKGASFNFIKDKVIDVLVSINYLFLIEKDLIHLPKGIAFNVHGSLLPKYRGRTPHVWAIINNEKITGITAHLIDEGCDTGDILKQVKVDILVDDTGATVLKKFENLYTKLIEEVFQDFISGNVVYQKQNNKIATYFGKRGPEDGQINWDWQKERIRNWVRAQAYPYPGAFSYYNHSKLIIDEIIYSNDGYMYNMPNGLILSLDPIKVKTPNGVVILNKIRNGNIDLKINECLNYLL